MPIPAPGWYLGSFNNVEWTQTTENDVILTAHQISQPVCAQIDLLLTGSATIPAASAPLAKVLIDGSRHSQGNAALDKTRLPGLRRQGVTCAYRIAARRCSAFITVIEQR